MSGLLKVIQMKKIILLAVFAFALLSVTSCKDKVADRYENRNAVWLWGSHMKEAPLQEWAEKGYGHVLLNEAAFGRWGEEDVYAFVKQCKDLGLVPHVWFQCFYKDGKWAYPVDDENKVIKQDFYDDIVARASNYVEKGFEGVHLDYIRFGGTAHKHDYPEAGLRATDVVTECCRQLNVALKAINPKVILSAALMPEIESERLYAQNPAEMGKWLDVLMPMVYRYGYGGEDKPLEWVYEVTNWFEERSGEAEVWVGIQTYKVNLTPEAEGEFSDGGHIIPLTAEELRSDMEDLKNTNATGVVLFRHGLGDFPDVNDLWD